MYRVRRLNEYKRISGYLLKDAFWRYRWISSGTVVLSLTAMASQFAAIGLVVLYVRLIQESPELRFGDLVIVPLSPAGSVLFGGGLLLLLIGHALSAYGAQALTIRARRSYGEFSMRRVLDYMHGPLPRKRLASFDVTGEKNLLRTLYKATRAYALTNGRVFQLCLNLFLPGLTMLVGFAVLLVVDPLITAVLLVIAAASLRYQVRTSIQAATVNREWEMSEGKVSAVVRRYLRRALDDKLTRDQVSGSLLDSSEGKYLQRNLNLRDERLRIIARSQLISAGTFVAAVMALIGWLVWRAGNGTANWDMVILYFLVLSRAFSGLKGFLSTLTNINRFYTQLGRYFSIVDTLQEASPATAMSMTE